MKPLKEETKKKLLELTGIEFTHAKPSFSGMHICLIEGNEERCVLPVKTPDQWIKENTVDAEEELRIMSNEMFQLNFFIYGAYLHDKNLFHKLAMWFKNYYDYGKETN